MRSRKTTAFIKGQWQCVCVIVSVPYSVEGLCKGKSLPRTGHEGPEGEWRYSSTLSLTSALDGGGWSTPCPSRFTPAKDPVPFVRGVGWAQGRSGQVQKLSPPPRYDPRTVQSVASRYTD
jgi:hypothetical protein